MVAEGAAIHRALGALSPKSSCKRVLCDVIIVSRKESARQKPHHSGKRGTLSGSSMACGVPDAPPPG